MIGMTDNRTAVSLALIQNMIPSDITSCNVYRTIIEMFSVTALCITAVSEANLLVNSPVLTREEKDRENIYNFTTTNLPILVKEAHFLSHNCRK